MNIIKLNLLIYIFITALVGVGASEIPNVAGSNKKIIEKRQKLWKKSLGRGNTEDIYTTDAILLYGNNLIRGKKNISDFYNSYPLYKSKIKYIDTVGKYQIKSISNIFEIGQYAINQKKFQYLVKWNKIGNQWYKDLEVVEEKINNNIDLEEVSKARDKWTELSMAHDVENLVESLYMAKTYYYSNGNLLDNSKSLIRKFSYMKNMGVIIKSNMVVDVSPNIVFEIGNYNTGDIYFGYYILVWKRDSSGKWKILLDAD